MLCASASGTSLDAGSKDQPGPLAPKKLVRDQGLTSSDFSTEVEVFGRMLIPPLPPP